MVVLHALLESDKVDVDEVDPSGLTSMNKATKYGYFPVINLLSDLAQVDVNRADVSGNAPLHHVGGKSGAAKALLRRADLDVAAVNKAGQTALHTAHGNVLGLLLDGRPSRLWHPDRRDGRGETALLVHSRRGDLDAVGHLLKIGADVNTANRTGMGPLSVAVTSHHDRVVERLLEHGDVDVNSVDADGRSALFWAASANITEYYRGVKEVLHPLYNFDYQTDKRKVNILANLSASPGIDPNLSDKNGWTPLGLAVFNNNPLFIRILLGKPKNPNNGSSIVRTFQISAVLTSTKRTMPMRPRYTSPHTSATLIALKSFSIAMALMRLRRTAMASLRSTTPT